MRNIFCGRLASIVCSVITVVLCLSSTSVLAQVTSGTIFGSVKDASGAVLPNATITVRADQIGFTRVVTSSANGDFVLPNLPPATYSIQVEAEGFKKLEARRVVLSAADKLNAGDFVLQVGATTETVNVTADPGQLQLQSNSGERSDLVTNKQLNEVAINGRNVLDYMKLVPGVISSFNGSVSGTGGLDAMNINGTRANQHEFTIDGASNVDTGNNGGTHVTINPDAIEEVKVLTSNYQAEFGKAAGGQIALVTKSGTNQWHGDGRFFHRNESLNANEWFNKHDQLSPSDPKATPPYNAPPLYRYNYVGYQIGGPVKKDKIFVFWSQEFYRQLIPINGTTQFYTPTSLERKGDFSQSVDGNGQPVVIYDPTTGNPFPNNKIDPTQLPAAQQAVFAQIQKVLNLYPLPNASGINSNGLYNYSTALSYTDPRREDIARVDYQLNANNRLFGRWIHNSDHEQAPFSTGGLGAVDCLAAINFPGGCIQEHPGWNLSVNLVSTIRPTLLNEFSIGPSVTKSLVTGANGNISTTKNGINLPLLFPSQTIPDMSFGGLNNVGFGWSYLGSMPWHQANTTINLNDNLSWVKGKHTVKTGVFYQRNRKDQIAWGNVNGQFTFNASSTSPTSACPSGTACGDPYASALLGDFTAFDQSTARPIGFFRYNQLEFYVQDTWKLTSKLTLDYGMRFAWIPPQYDAKNQIALFDPASYDRAKAVTVNTDGSLVSGSGNPLNGMRFTASNTIPAGGWNDRSIMPEPRLGFAYDLFSSHKTVLRGGAGMMHDRVQGNLIFNPVFSNPAVVQTVQLASGNIVNLSSAQTSLGSAVLGNIVGAAKSGNVPTVYSFSLGIQQEVGRGTTLDVAYVGTLSRHLVTSRDINAIPYGYAFTRAAQDPSCFGGTVPAVEPGLLPQYAAAGYSFSGVCAYGHSSYTDAVLVPYKGYGQIPYLRFDGTSNYNSLQVSLQRRFSKGFTFGTVYTYSKALATASSDQDTQDPFNPRALDYRAASWDRTHVFAANYVYDIPGLNKHFGGPKWLSYITDNYQLSGITEFQTGAPIDTGNNWAGEPGALDGSNMWGAIPLYYAFDKNLNPLLPAIGPQVRPTRDLLRTGGMQNWDMSIFKNIPLGRNEARFLQLRLEAFNAFNHPNFYDKNYSVDLNGPWQWQPGTAFSISQGSGWGKNTDTYSGVGGFRVIQLGAKIYF